MNLLLVFLFIKGSFAADLDQRAQMLLKAKDPKDLKMKIHSYNEYQKLETHCEFELANTLVPKSCYQLKLSKAKTEVVDQACERASLVMKEEVPLKGLSTFCAELINKRNKDIRYNKEEESPEKFVLKF